MLREAHRQLKAAPVGAEIQMEAVREHTGLGFHDGLDADSRGAVYLTDLAQGAIQVYVVLVYWFLGVWLYVYRSTWIPSEPLAVAVAVAVVVVTSEC